MKAKRVTVLLFVTVISLLTIFLVVLMDDTVLAADNSGEQMLQNRNLYWMAPESMVVTTRTYSGSRILQDELEPMEAV